MPERYKALQQDFARLEADFQMLADSISQLAWMARPDGHIFWYNKRWFDYTGTTLEEMEGWGWRKVHHPDHVDGVVERITQSFAAGERWEDTFPLLGRDGEYRWFLSRAMPMRGETGEIIRWFGTNTDITEQRRITERQALLMREIDHRAKNALAVAQSLVHLTNAPTVEAYKAAVEGRIGSLARVHSLLAAWRWDGADLETLLREETASFDSEPGERISLSGPHVLLTPAMAQSLALIIHELTTNAAKYGALSQSGGRLDIRWTNTAGGVEIAWRESGCTGIETPQGKGFGTQLIDRILADFAGGTLTRTWAAQGLQIDIDLPAPRPAQAPPSLTLVTAEPAAQPPGKPAILVVEDEPLTALDLEMRLCDAGYDVIGPANSIAAARLALEGRMPDIALMDSNLRGERSFALAEELCAAGIPVIFCTGYETLDGRSELLAACPIVSKPFQDEALFAAIEAALHPAGAIPA